MIRRLPALLGLVVIGAACGDTDTADDPASSTDDLAERITSLEERAAEAEARASEAETRIVDLEAQAGDAESRLAAAEEALVELSSGAAAMEAALDSRIADLEVLSVEHESRIAAIESRTTDAESRITTVETTVEGSLDDHETRLASLEEWTGSADSRIDSLDASLSSNIAALAANDATQQAEIELLDAWVGDIEADLAELTSESDTFASDTDARLSTLEDSVARLFEGMAFVGENDASFSLFLGDSEDSGDVTVDDSAVASYGAVLAGEGAMHGTTFETMGLDAGVYAVEMSFQWGAGIAEEAVTQRFKLNCTGADVVYQPRTTIAAGDADSDGINVAYPITVRAWVRTVEGDGISCALTKRTVDIARTGDGILYNDINGPIVATVQLVIPE